MQIRLTDLVRRRRQLVDMLAMEKQRDHLPDDARITGSLERHLAFLVQEIAAIDQEIARDGARGSFSTK